MMSLSETVDLLVEVREETKLGFRYGAAWPLIPSGWDLHIQCCIAPKLELAEK